MMLLSNFTYAKFLDDTFGSLPILNLIFPSFLLPPPQATNEEFKEEFAQAQKTSYGQAIGGNGSSFLRDLEYDGLGGYGLGLRDDDNDSDPDGQEPFEVSELPLFCRFILSASMLTPNPS